MFKRVGVLALILSAASAVLPTAAFAQDRYYGRQDYHYRDGDRDRHERREWRERERHEDRNWRRQERREQHWREHEFRERSRMYDRSYRPNAFYFGYDR